MGANRKAGVVVSRVAAVCGPSRRQAQTRPPQSRGNLSEERFALHDVFCRFRGLVFHTGFLEARCLARGSARTLEGNLTGTTLPSCRHSSSSPLVWCSL